MSEDFDPGNFQFDQATSHEDQMLSLVQKAGSATAGDSVPSMAGADIQVINPGSLRPNPNDYRGFDLKDPKVVSELRERSRNSAALKVLQERDKSQWGNSKKQPETAAPTPGSLAAEEERLKRAYSSEVDDVEAESENEVPEPESVEPEKPRSRPVKQQPKPKRDFNKEVASPPASPASPGIGIGKVLKIITDGTVAGTSISLDGKQVTAAELLVFRYDKAQDKVSCQFEISKKVTLY